MRVAIAVAALACASLLAGPAHAQPKATADIKDASGKSLGEAVLAQRDGTVEIDVTLTGLPKGTHAFHIHEVGRCDPPFESAGGHFNPEHKQHGKDNPQGPHAGDIPNFTVDAKGGSTASVVAPGVTMDDGPNSVFTGGGTALVIHEKADDMKTDPAGAAGNRIACGLIKK